jgi:Cell wall-active antibiotics response 4TMS YvqF
VTAMLAETKRVGPWSVPPTIDVHVILGSAVVDLTEATFTSRRVEINCTQFLGSIVVRVPPGTSVRVESANVLGDSSVKEIGEPNDAQPTVVVRGTNILGDISVRGPKRPPIWKRNVA